MKQSFEITRGLCLNRVLARIAYAHDQALYALACDAEASIHYGLNEHASMIWQIRLYVCGALKGLMARTIPDHIYNTRVRRLSATYSTKPTLHDGDIHEENCGSPVGVLCFRNVGEQCERGGLL